MRYVAIINTPGYLPQDDEPAEFDDPAEAWDYLYQERRNALDEAGVTGDPDDPYDGDDCLRYINAKVTVTTEGHGLAEDSVYGDTPGYEGSHDLGIVYSVQVVESDEDNSEGESKTYCAAATILYGTATLTIRRPMPSIANWQSRSTTH